MKHIVLNKRGFAFIDCPDQVALDKAIEKLSGLKINGKEISVEHSGETSNFKINFDIKFLDNLYLVVKRFLKLSSTYFTNEKSADTKHSLYDELGRFGFFALEIRKSRVV